jgi:hypothetical protein
MLIIFVVVLRMSTALGYEFDECVAGIFFFAQIAPEIIGSFVGHQR